MSNGKRRKPTGEEVLAAIARALRAEVQLRGGGVWLSDVVQHLEMTWHSGTARTLQPILTSLGTQGLIRQVVPRAWTLTDDGRQRVAEAWVTLPPSPQRRRWRQARELAEEYRDEFRQDLINAIKAATEMLNAREPATGVAWEKCGERLDRCCKAIAHVNFALHESVDPGDGPAKGERWIDFWLRYGLRFRYTTVPRRKRKNPPGDKEPAVIDLDATPDGNPEARAVAS